MNKINLNHIFWIVIKVIASWNLKTYFLLLLFFWFTHIKIYIYTMWYGRECEELLKNPPGASKVSFSRQWLHEIVTIISIKFSRWFSWASYALAKRPSVVWHDEQGYHKFDCRYYRFTYTRLDFTVFKLWQLGFRIL